MLEHLRSLGLHGRSHELAFGCPLDRLQMNAKDAFETCKLRLCPHAVQIRNHDSLGLGTSTGLPQILGLGPRKQSFGIRNNNSNQTLETKNETTSFPLRDVSVPANTPAL